MPQKSERTGDDLLYRLAAHGSFIITDETGRELFRVTAEGDAVKVLGIAITPGEGSGIPQGGPLTEALDADGFRITGLADPVGGQDAVSRAYFLLLDPENLWAAETVFSDGDRIQVGGDGKLFQAGGGTTGTEEPDWDAVPPLDVVMDGDVEWRYIGFLGELFFEYVGASVPALVPKAAHVSPLDLTVSDPPEQTEVQAIADGFDALIASLIAAGRMAAS